MSWLESRRRLNRMRYLLVVDALTGQDAVNAAEGFNEKLGIDGIIMTKMDGDSRGGAALSAKKVTGKPVKFVGMGEKTGRTGTFPSGQDGKQNPREWEICSRLSKRLRKAMTRNRQPSSEKKIRKNEFTLEDFLEQMGQIQQDGRPRQDAGHAAGYGRPESRAMTTSKRAKRSSNRWRPSSIP